MSEVILAVSARPERVQRLLGAARRLATLSGGGAIRVLALPSSSRPVTVVSRPESGITEWMEASAAPDLAVQERGCRADFIVVELPEPGDDKPIRQAFRAALFRTERPVLVVPPTGPADGFGQLAAIAWRDDPHTLKAMIPALRLLTAADQVHLLAGVRPGEPTPRSPAVLLEHGVRAELHVLAIGTEPFGQTLLRRAHELKADLLVMGAYVHGVLRDMVLGGVTRHVLAHADIPVLMRH